jgi:Cu-Zn family superoxide dismutase
LVATAPHAMFVEPHVCLSHLDDAAATNPMEIAMSGVRLSAVVVTASLVATGAAMAAEKLKVDIKKISEAGVGETVGTATLTETKKGVAIAVKAKGIAKGDHGFHLHEKGDCGPAAGPDGKMAAGLAAGGHFDPDATKSHKGPGKGGHKGDLPPLKATDKGVSQTLTVAHIKLADAKGRSLMIHDGGDNYTDQPANGGGGGRIACAVIPAK